MKCTNNKPTAGIKLCLTLMFLFCTATVEAVIPVPDGTSASLVSKYLRGTTGLEKVVDNWIKGGHSRAIVENEYGLIQDWDTSEVTSMQSLFNQKDTFNSDLSKWNVANVTSMLFSTCQFPLFNSPLHHLLFFLFLSPYSNVII